MVIHTHTHTYRNYSHSIFLRSPKTKDAFKWIVILYRSKSMSNGRLGHCIHVEWHIRSNNYTVLCSFRRIRHWNVNSKWFSVPLFNVYTRHRIRRLYSMLMWYVSQTKLVKDLSTFFTDIFVFVVLAKMRFWWSSWLLMGANGTNSTWN